jgi:Cu(I)/Ag(I) efflux system protein CusF
VKSIKFLALGAAAALSFSSAAFAQHEGHGQMTAEQHKQMMAGDGAASEKVTHATGV